MKTDKIYRPLVALELMGILCSKHSADIYICNMKKAGLFKTSYKLNNRWYITQSDIDYIRPMLMSGEYKPSAKWHKQAA